LGEELEPLLISEEVNLYTFLVLMQRILGLKGGGRYFLKEGRSSFGKLYKFPIQISEWLVF
jgi:hypothetical protein